MPPPKRSSVEDFLSNLEDRQRGHLDRLRALSLDADDALVEGLAWNTPAYTLDGDRLWMLQAFKNHCSVRFSTDWFADHQAEVVEAGHDHGAGFLKLPYDREVPDDLVRALLSARIADARAV